VKVCVLFSGGKDSTYTLWLALHQYNVKYLVTVLSKKDSFLYHYQQKKIAQTLADAIRIPLKLVEISPKEDELDKLEEVVKSLEIEAICIGGLLSEYQRTRFNDVALRLSIPCFTPLWRKDQLSIVKELANQFTVMITTISSMGFTVDDLGRIIDQQMVQRLINLNKNFGISIGGEGGEYETLVLDAPFYKKRIVIEESKKEWDETKFYGYIKISKLRTKDKSY
jgi:ABC transporter with metal-binding/Fe-S-binding domain ATP-binding protein